MLNINNKISPLHNFKVKTRQSKAKLYITNSQKSSAY